MHEMEHLEQPINPMIRLICCDGFWQSEIIDIKKVLLIFILRFEEEKIRIHMHAHTRKFSIFSLLSLAAS